MEKKQVYPLTVSFIIHLSSWTKNGMKPYLIRGRLIEAECSAGEQSEDKDRAVMYRECVYNTLSHMLPHLRHGFRVQP